VPPSPAELAFQLHAQGRAAEAEAAYRAALKVQKQHGGLWHGLGSLYLESGRPDLALEPLEKAAKSLPQDSAIRARLGHARLQLGRPADAVRAFAKATDLAPGDPEIWFALAYACGQMEDWAGAERAYRSLLTLVPGHIEGLNNLAATLQAQGRVPDAVSILRSALDAAPGSLPLMANLAHMLEMMNDLHAAAALAAQVLAADPAQGQTAILAARIHRRMGDAGAAADGLQKLLRTNPPPALEAAACAELGQVLDRLGDAKGAFAAYARSNQLMAQLTPRAVADPARAQALVTRNQNFYSAGRLAAWRQNPISPGPEPDPIFFVGFPRSGTTLMEEMLARAPELITSGEKSPLEAVQAELEVKGVPLLDSPRPAELERLRRLFWARADHLFGPRQGRRLLDKLPLNLIELGLIERLFPKARIIMALRDPRDVVLSNFAQEFDPNDAMANFWTIEGAAHFYAQVMSLWQHYDQHLALPRFTYRYEDFVGDPERVTRALFAFLDLPWRAEILDHRAGLSERYVATPSRAQVAEPISKRAVGRWRAYAGDLAPILPILSPFAAAFGYDAAGDNGGTA